MSSLSLPLKRCVTALILGLCFFASLAEANGGVPRDTVIVQTLTFDSLGRAGVFHFPDTGRFEKVIMQYSLRCKGGLISTSSERNKGCGEWDYNCETFVVDSSRIDSTKAFTPSSIISNYPQYKDFPKTSKATSTVQRHSEFTPTYNPVPTFNLDTANAGSTPLEGPGKRTLYLLRASDLRAAGLKTGSIQGLKFKILADNGTLSHFTIRIAATKDTVVRESMIRDTSMIEVYAGSPHVSPSSTALLFYKPFNWVDTQNVILELTNGNSFGVSGRIGSYNAELSSNQNEPSLLFSGSQVLQLPPNDFPSISDQITVAFWAYGDPMQIPGANTIAIEGIDAQGNRQVNVHLPWSDRAVYWDCGAVGGAGDRISKAVPVSPGWTSTIAGRWNHWAFTKNVTTGRMSIFLNGHTFATDTGKHRMISVSKMNLGAGATSAIGYQGKLSQFGLFSRALDSISIQRLMQFGIDSIGGAKNDALVFYPLNEGVGAVLTDRSNHNRLARLTGIPTWRPTNGIDAHKDFKTTTTLPTMVFLQSLSAQSPQAVASYYFDTLQDPPYSSISYSVVKKNLGMPPNWRSGNPDDSLAVIDTNYVWLATKSYTYDESVKKIDSVNIAAEDTIRVSRLTYMQRWPQRFEIMSFVTPYGIGLDLGKKGTRWEFDATDYLPLLKGNKRLSVERGNTQEELDIRFLFIKGTPAHDVLDIQQLWPMTEEGYQSILSNDKYEPRDVTFLANASQLKLRSMITGHGQQGEFETQLHHVTLGSKKYEWEVVKFCADNPLYPQGGTWVYTRAGWCPGAASLETEYDLAGAAVPGNTLTVDYGIGGASGDSRYDVSNQLVSYGAPNFTRDASIYQIVRPSSRIEFARINPACDEPIITIQNTGSAQLTGLKIDYYTTDSAGHDGPHESYLWSGSLKFLDTLSVPLPVDSLGFWIAGQTATFHADISFPTGDADEYEPNNHYSSIYTQPPTYKGAIVVNFKSNNNPEENRYEVRDMSGKVVLSRDNFDANTTYYDSLALPNGCYTLTCWDDGPIHDGLSWWANSAQGTGYLRLRQDSRTGKILKTLNPDFGSFTQMDFSIVTSSIVSSVDGPKAYTRFSMFPNPAHTTLSVELEGYKSDRLTYQIVDALGRVVRSQRGSSHIKLDLHGLALGAYHLRVSTSQSSFEKPFVIE